MPLETSWNSSYPRCFYFFRKNHERISVKARKPNLRTFTEVVRGDRLDIPGSSPLGRPAPESLNRSPGKRYLDLPK